MASGPAPSPYKFLDAYGREDRDVFFGRERETQILLSDVMVSRLVVLFARTGTGKTSLINAGVRPALEDRGYATFMVRVRQDPAASARDELLGDSRISGLASGSLPLQLERVVGALEQPIVVFFDQFEEFFIYLMSRREQRERARQFISDVASIHGNRDSGVHLVFSMREDFMAAMDDFREKIPTIFHQDSSLRLRWFDDEQAEAAIGGPAAARGVPFEPELVRRMIEDLRDEDRVEPAQLQIVCDTLWRRAQDGRVTLADYVALGERRGAGTIAERILRQRLEEEFEKVESRERLELLADLLPRLRTPKHTKYIRDIPSLARELDTAEELLRTTLLHLEERSRLVRLYIRGGVEYVELTHDYLVNHLDGLAAAIGGIWPRRVLREAMAWTGELDFEAKQDVEDVLDRVRREHRRARDGAGPAPGDMSLDAGEAAFLLRFALDAPMQSSVLVDAFALAQDHGAPALSVVLQALEAGPAAAESAIELLVAIGEVKFLPAVIGRGDDRARHAVDMLSTVETKTAVDLISGGLAVGALDPAPKLALTRLAASRRAEDVAAHAARVLVGHVVGRLDESGVGSGVADLGRIEHVIAVDALARLLDQRPTHAADVRNALLRIGGSTNPGAAERAVEVLLARLSGPVGLAGVPPHRARASRRARQRRRRCGARAGARRRTLRSSGGECTVEAVSVSPERRRRCGPGRHGAPR